MAEIKSMTKEPIEVLDDLATQVADEFEASAQVLNPCRQILLESGDRFF
jgi:hypothetical protein